MKYYVRKIIDFFIFSNIFISLCAVAQGLVTYHLLNSPPNPIILAFLFSSTLVTYNFSILIQRKAIKKRSRFRRIRWIYWHQSFCRAITLVAFLSLIPLFFALNIQSQATLCIMGLLSIGYSLPIFSSKNRRFGIRNIPGLKLFLIALVWAASCVTVPILELNAGNLTAISLSDTIILTVKRFLFITAITIPFDIRDLYQDRANELKTIPTLLGERKAYLFCQLLLLIYVVLLFIFNKGFDLNFFGLTATIALTGWLIFRSNFKKNEYYYFFFMDGTMILQYLILYTFSFVK